MGNFREFRPPAGPTKMTFSKCCQFILETITKVMFIPNFGYPDHIEPVLYPFFSICHIFPLIIYIGKNLIAHPVYGNGCKSKNTHFQPGTPIFLDF